MKFTDTSQPAQPDEQNLFSIDDDATHCGVCRRVITRWISENNSFLPQLMENEV